ncbi:MAG: hypothetical protein ABI824_10030 [Acidobacteriota bacterium]
MTAALTATLVIISATLSVVTPATAQTKPASVEPRFGSHLLSRAWLIRQINRSCEATLREELPCITYLLNI